MKSVLQRWFVALAAMLNCMSASQLTAAELLQPCECGDLAIQVHQFTDDEWEVIEKLRDDSQGLNAVLKVYALPEDNSAEDEIDVPPLFGNAVLDKSDRNLYFEPKYDLQSGVQYRIVLQLKDQKQTFSLYRAPYERIPTTVVSEIYPTADQLPENLLKFYIHFSSPMSSGNVYQYIDLVDQDGRHLERPFLEIAEELWDSSGTRLTLLLDPARVKRELVPHEEDGAILYAGRKYLLKIKSEWQDANGTTLKESFTKPFTTVAADYVQPNPAYWRITPPSAGGSDALHINLIEPLDHAIVTRGIKVIDPDEKEVDGEVSLSAHEMMWAFTPKAPWKSGNYRLKINERIEDLVGNSIAKPFEVDRFDQIESTKPSYRELKFKIEPTK